MFSLVTEMMTSKYDSFSPIFLVQKFGRATKNRTKVSLIQYAIQIKNPNLSMRTPFLWIRRPKPIFSHNLTENNILRHYC